MLLAPAARRPFPTLSPQSLKRSLDPYPAAFPRCAYPFLPQGHRPCVRTETLGTRTDLCKATLAEGVFRGCSHSLMFRLPNLLGPPVAPTARVRCPLGSRAVYTTQCPSGYPSQAVVSLRVRIGQLTRQDFHLQDCGLVGRYQTPDPFFFLPGPCIPSTLSRS